MSQDQLRVQRIGSRSLCLSEVSTDSRETSTNDCIYNKFKEERKCDKVEKCWTVDTNFTICYMLFKLMIRHDSDMRKT